MALRSSSKDSSMFEAAKNASKPASLADQTPAMGALEADFRAQKDARRQAMRETNTDPKIDSEAKQTTGSPKRMKTVRVDSKRQV